MEFMRLGEFAIVQPRLEEESCLLLHAAMSRFSRGMSSDLASSGARRYSGQAEDSSGFPRIIIAN